VPRSRKAIPAFGPAAALWLALTLVACAGPTQAREAMSFSPGEWSNAKTGLALTLDAGGSGEASNIPYVPVSQFPSCPVSGDLPTYSGPVAWTQSPSTENPHVTVVLVDTPKRESVEFFPWRWPPEDWARVQTWPCGDPDGVAPYELDRPQP